MRILCAFYDSLLWDAQKQRERESRCETIYDPNKERVLFQPKEVDCAVFTEKREKRTYSHPVDLTAYHGQVEFKVAKNYATQIHTHHLPIWGMYWKSFDYKLKVKAWYYIDNYRQFAEISDRDYVEIYRSYGGDFKKCRFRCDTKFFKIIQCYIFMNGLDKKVPNYGTGGDKFLGRKTEEGYDKSRLTINMGGKRRQGKPHSMDPMKAHASGDALTIAEAISCKCDVHAAFARAKRNGEMEYI